MKNMGYLQEEGFNPGLWNNFGYLAQGIYGQLGNILYYTSSFAIKISGTTYELLIGIFFILANRNTTLL